ncbi:MAG: carboxymuconolactone decarboxylase family protein [Proteobacteria bacterium]|nr:carboxymuconolactone decarboxylase family protein [Pseudomonadota bacterium]MBU1585031.1 carboxymuconolactone decarboxylase family protein [Pseudomonadota bacterium]MBU2453739.1 carboxymuconolactone decarboxylase family protein [Pseudomonadota bacterium]MBU2629036.1 carboxymuconolactone decarboxylase family protein [Pseudomonadota bacterium]
MCRLQFIEPDKAEGPTKEIFKKLVLAPNVLCLMANSHSVLDTYVNHHVSLNEYKLSAKYRKLISLAVSQFNDCAYCIALHTATAVDGEILTKKECLEGRRMKSSDPKADALLAFTKEVLEKKGKVNEDTLFLTKNQGFDDQEIVEALAVISFITLANLTANVGEPELDFLEPQPLTELK